ncbi:MAG: hypothetical protein WC520_05105 [Candidatus Paceibacterota bacterium]
MISFSVQRNCFIGYRLIFIFVGGVIVLVVQIYRESRTKSFHRFVFCIRRWSLSVSFGVEPCAAAKQRGTIPLYSCRRRSLPAGGFKGAALWAERAELRSNSGLAVVGAWVPARERSGGQVEMGGREGATARVSRRLWNGCGPAAPPNVEGRAKRSPND